MDEYVYSWDYDNHDDDDNQPVILLGILHAIPDIDTFLSLGFELGSHVLNVLYYVILLFISVHIYAFSFLSIYLYDMICRICRYNFYFYAYKYINKCYIKI